MERTKKELRSLYLWFVYSTLLFLLGARFLHSFTLSYYVPFLVMVITRLDFQVTLKTVLFVGVWMDLVSSFHSLGVYPLILLATTCLLYRQRRFFFRDSLSTLPLLTGLFSLLFHLLLLFYTALFEARPPMGRSSLFNELLVTSLFDMVYATLFFVLPEQLIQRVTKIRRQTS